MVRRRVSACCSALASRVLCLALLLLGALVPFTTAQKPGVYALIADAGSTGTRVYLYSLDSNAADQNRSVKITDIGKGPALSSFRERPEQAAEAVRQQLQKAKESIPEEAHGGVPLSVFATAGMRLLPQESQDAIYRGLKAGLLEDGYPFDPLALEARTITGREEGVFALIAANYLAKTLRIVLPTSDGSADTNSLVTASASHEGPSLQPTGQGLIGVLDLGGSSTQVAVPPTLAHGESLALKLGAEHTFVRSFLNLGMERMRQRTYERLIQAADAALRERREVPNPCAFGGYAEDGSVWRGSGNAAECEAAASAVILEERASCETAAVAAGSDAQTAECLGEAPAPAKQEGVDSAAFYLISGYLYVTEFARWWLSGPHSADNKFKASGGEAFDAPTVAEIREAAAKLCAEPWDTISVVALDPKLKSRFTGAHKVPHRCFELNYIAALLSAGYGFHHDSRLFRIVEDIDGSEIEWTLGAFLHELALRHTAPHSNEL